MISIKDSVSIQGMRPELMFGVLVAYDAYTMWGCHFTLTSVCDGKHSETSLHYSGCAFDCRTRDVDPNILDKIVEQIADGLGEHFDVIKEETHLHIEYQPRFSG